MNFRHDINGLRAIAVINVVLFHFQVPGFSAGFLGVDVFFVISGFLMAAILLRGLEAGYTQSFPRQLWSFYIARARRILPALLVLVTTLMVAGWWTLGPDDYERLAKHARYAVVFASNYQFYDEAGYFDVQSHEKWLLHTWSLSVEWQFYLLLPLLLLVLWKIKPDRLLMLWVVGVTAVISFLYGAMQTSANPEAAFYLLPSRAWELLVGVFVYLISARIVPQARWSRGLDVIGLSLIILALFLYNKNMLWPGVAALLPVTGTALVLLAGKQTPAWAMPATVQWLGKSSYSLYLWHWPVFVALVFLDLQGSTFAIIAGIAIALLLGAISYAYVEQPTRKGLMRLGMKWAAVPLVIAASGIASAAVLIGKMDGLPERMPEEFNLIMAETKNVNPHRQNCHGHPRMEAFPWCILGGSNIKAVIVGDSHAASVVTAVRDALRLAANEGVVMASYTSCQTILGIRKTNPRLQCDEFNQFVIDQLQMLPDDVPLIIAARLSAAIFGSHLRHEKSYGIPTLYFGDVPHTTVTDDYLGEVRSNMIVFACSLSRNRPVYWLTPFPELPKDAPRWLARKVLLTGGAELSISRAEYEERNRFVKTLLAEAEAQCPNFRVIDVAPVFCDDARCYGSKDGMPLFYDEHHVSERGNRLLIPLFTERLSTH